MPTPGPQPMHTPAVDLIIDGDRHDARVHTELAGRGLTYAPGVDARREPVLYAFSSPTGLTEHLAAAEPLAFEMAGDIGTTNPDSLSAVSRYFEHAGQGGDQLSNNPGRAWRDLTQVRRGFLGLGNWNDVISSVDWCRWDLMLYEHVGYGGARLFLRAGRPTTSCPTSAGTTWPPPPRTSAPAADTGTVSQRRAPAAPSPAPPSGTPP